VIGDDLTTGKRDHAPTKSIHDFAVMRHEHDRRAKSVNFEEKINDLARVDGVKISRRFIRKQDLWTMHEGTRDHDALLLAAGELTRKAMWLFFEPDDLQHVWNDFLNAARRLPRNFKGKRNVFVYGFLRQKLKILKDNANLAPQERDISRADVRNLPSADRDRSARRTLFRNQELGERCFACAALTDD